MAAVSRGTHQKGEIVDFREWWEQLDRLEGKVDDLLEHVERLDAMLEEFAPLIDEGRRRLAKRDRATRLFTRGTTDDATRR